LTSTRSIDPTASHDKEASMSKLSFAGSVLALGVAMATLCPLASAQTTAPVVKKGIIVQGGREAIGPKQDDPRAVNEGGCDDGGTVAPATGSDDPAAKKGIIVQGGLEAIGPKQDDPRAVAGASTATRAIGPKQDDPRALTTACQRKKSKR
jgi:hypothetical protein